MPALAVRRAHRETEQDKMSHAEDESTRNQTLEENEALKAQVSVLLERLIAAEQQKLVTTQRLVDQQEEINHLHNEIVEMSLRDTAEKLQVFKFKKEVKATVLNMTSELRSMRTELNAVHDQLHAASVKNRRMLGRTIKSVADQFNADKLEEDLQKKSSWFTRWFW